MADWMFRLSCGDDLTSTPKERRNRRATSSASAPREHVLLCGELFLGNQGVPLNGVFQTQPTWGKMRKKYFPELTNS